MRKIFCILVLALVCVSNVFSEVKHVTCNKWGESLYYGEKEAMIETSRYMWFSGQDKMDVNPENATIWGSGSEYSDYGDPVKVMAEAERVAKHDFKVKMKVIYHDFLGKSRSEEFFNEMLTRCKVSRTSWTDEDKKGKCTVWAYCVYAMTQTNLKKYYPDVYEVMKNDWD